MTSATLLRRASVALAAFTLACGDSTGPSNLSEAEVGDLLDAMSVVASYGVTPGAAMSAGGTAALRLANATLTLSETVDCPNGGTASVNGTVTEDEASGTGSAQITQTFNNCAATSSEGRVWTFNGDPSIVTNVSSSYNETTGAFSMTATQVGGIRFSSNVGTGSCQLNLTVTMSADENSFSMTLSGSACGRNVQQSIEYTA